MQEQNTRKMDRRTIYTRNTVKDALLELLEEQSFEKITVASLCRQAEITRATFYLHFQSLDEVLDELLNDALMVAEAASNEMRVEERMEALRAIVLTGDADTLRKNERLLPPCQRVADDPKYRAVFMDSTLTDFIINRIYMLERGQSVPYMQEKFHLDRETADRIFMMLICGLFYVNRSLKWNKDNNWYEMQLIINRFIFGGWEALGKG